MLSQEISHSSIESSIWAKEVTVYDNTHAHKLFLHWMNPYTWDAKLVHSIQNKTCKWQHLEIFKDWYHRTFSDKYLLLLWLRWHVWRHRKMESTQPKASKGCIWVYWVPKLLWCVFGILYIVLWAFVIYSACLFKCASLNFWAICVFVFGYIKRYST